MHFQPLEVAWVCSICAFKPPSLQRRALLAPALPKMPTLP